MLKKKRPTNEGLIIAAQDQSLATRSYHNKIIKDGTDPKCRMCNEFEETIDHIVAAVQYLQKRNIYSDMTKQQGTSTGEYASITIFLLQTSGMSTNPRK